MRGHRAQAIQVFIFGIALAVAAPSASSQTPPASPPPEEVPPSRIPDSVRQRDTIGGDLEAAPRLDNEPFDPTLKGFFAIPGTDAHLKIDGYLQLDVIHDFVPSGDPDRFIVGTIPVGVVSRADNTSIHARQSRVNLDLRRPTPLGRLRVFVETDFFSSAGERALQLRHAYGHVANLLVGFTISTLQDADAKADTLDYEGPPGLVSLKHAQVRYTRALSRRQSLAAALEAPRADIPSSVSGEAVTTRTPWPDLVLRYRFESRRGHLQAGGVWRSIGGFVGDGARERQVRAGGGSVSGSFLLWRRDVMTFQLNAGKGLARYINDTAGAGLDLGRDADGTPRAVPLMSITAAFQHAWHARWRSTFAASVVTLDNTPGQPSGVYHESRYLMANVIYKPTAVFSMGLEVDLARLEVSGGGRGAGRRAQISMQYAFLK